MSNKGEMFSLRAKVYLGSIAVVAVFLGIFVASLVAARRQAKSDTEANAVAAENAPASQRLIISSFGGAWGEALQKGFIDDFERETGIQVILLDDQNLARTIAAIHSGNPPDADIVNNNAITLGGIARDGYFEAIDYTTFDHETLEQLPRYARGKYELVFGIAALALCYDQRAFPDGGPQPQNWAAYFDPRAFPGKRAQLDWMRGDIAYEIALLGAGVRTDALYPINIDLALATQARILPHILAFPQSSAVLHQLLIDREVVMIQCFTHRAQRLIDEGNPHIAIVWKQAQLKKESLAIWRNAPNRDNAQRFLAYAATAKAQARWAAIATVGPVNPQAFAFLSQANRDSLPTSPRHVDTFMTNYDWYLQTDENGRTRFEVLAQDIWPRFLAKHRFR